MARPTCSVKIPGIGIASLFSLPMESMQPFWEVEDQMKHINSEHDRDVMNETLSGLPFTFEDGPVFSCIKPTVIYWVGH